MNKMIISNLVYRPIRSLISITAIAVEVTLILIIVGLSIGILTDSKNRQAGIGADIMVRPPGSSFISGVTGAPVSIKVADRLRQLEHVEVVSPVVTQLSTGGAVEVIFGIDLPTYEKLGTPFQFLDGGPFTGPYTMLVDNYLAEANNLAVGDKMEVLNHEFTISGIVMNGKGARKFLPIDTMQELIGAEGKASVFYVTVDDPEIAPQVVERIKQIPGMEQYNVLTLREWLSLMMPSNLPGFNAFITVVIGVAVCIGFIVIFQSMYTAVMERTREIGILKSLGASKAYIVRLILRETLVLALSGIVVGVLLSFAVRAVIVEQFPTVRVLVEWEWVVRATIIALAGALLGALYPAYRAAQKDPIDALAYE